MKHSRIPKWESAMLCPTSPIKRTAWTKELIDKDKLTAEVELSKEVAGIRMESEGYQNTYDIKITLCRSYTSLLKDGII